MRFFNGLDFVHPFLNLMMIHLKFIVPWIAEKTLYSQSTDDSMPSQTVQITHFQDANSVDSITAPSTISSTLRNMVNTYPSQTPTNILTRNYKVAEIAWGPGAPTTTTLDFPKILLTNPNIVKRLTGFLWMRAGVKLEVKINATGFHYGAFMISWLPNHDNNSHATTVFQQSGNHPLILSPAIQNSCVIDIPWINPYNFFPIQDPLSTTSIARVYFTPLTPLSRTTPDVSDTVYIQVFASFTDPETAGYTAQSSSTMKTESANKSRLQITDLIPAQVSTVMEKIPILGEAWSLLAPIISALDKPTSISALQPVSLQFSRDLSHGSGLDNSNSLSLKTLAPINLDQSLMGESTNTMSLKDIISVPMIYDITTFTNSSPALNFVLVPNANPNDYLGFVSRFFHYWRGSIKIQLNFYTSSFITGRFRVSVLYDNVFPTDLNAGDVISRIIDVKGDTSISFTVPYLWDATYRALNDANLPTLYIQRVTPIIGQSLATDSKIHLVTWRAAGEDFQFNQLVDHYSGFDVLDFDSDIDDSSSYDAQTDPRADFKKVFDPIVNGSCFVRETGIITGEIIDSVHDITKRYCSGVNYSGGSFRTDPQPNLFSGPFHRLAAIFKYYRGSRRIKIVTKKDPNVVVGLLMQNPGGTLDAANGMTYTMNELWPTLEAEIPWYSSVPFWPVDETSVSILRNNDRPRSVDALGFSPGSEVGSFISGGDDFTYGFLIAP
jgi:hypothetical protein